MINKKRFYVRFRQGAIKNKLSCRCVNEIIEKQQKSKTNCDFPMDEQKKTQKLLNMNKPRQFENLKNTNCLEVVKYE